MSIYDDFLKRDRRALGKVITHVENRRDDYRQLLARLASADHHAYRIGITGPPGSGKSTLVDQMASVYASQGKKIGVIAVDPSSPFTGGALLGDRIRMQHIANKENVYIRSMASRGKSGGLARATRDVAMVLDAFGLDFLLIETVGIGQIELDIVDACDSVVVVLVPESGDMIQTMKAGLMEIADIFCVNKIDRQGGDRLVSALNAAIRDRARGDGKRQFPAIGTNGLTGQGVDKLLKTVEEHRNYIVESGEFGRRRASQMRAEVLAAVRDKIMDRLATMISLEKESDQFVQELASGKIDPYSAAELFYDRHIRGRLIND